MYTRLTKLILWLLTKYVHSFFKGKTVYVFSGVRRSGNHACINWMANAVMQQKTDMERQGYMVFQSSCETLLHLNEVNIFSPFDYAGYLRKNRRLIEKASVIFVSVEDLVPNEHTCLYYPKGSKVIYITRDILSTLASRLAYNIKRAKDGIDRGDMHIDQNTFNLTKRIRTKTHVWEFDKWLSDSQWRSQFLARFNLQYDIEPAMSTQGGGSTFHGQDKQAATNMTDAQRWSKVEWSPRIKELVKANPGLLSENEKAFTQSW